MNIDPKAISSLPKIGHGGQSNVYKYESNKALFAIKKLINPKRVERFRLEIQAMIRLHSDGCNVAKICHSEINEKHAFYVMPFFVNGSLDSSWNKILGTKSLEDKLLFFISLSNELNKIHDAGYVHRDIKAENILIDDNAVPLFSDFGISYTKESDDRVTGTAEILGSRHWTAPELHNGKSLNGSEAGDYFSMGKLLYFIITGKRLLGIGMHNEIELEPIPGKIRPILSAMLSLDPAVRARLWNDSLLALTSIVTKHESGAMVEVSESVARVAAADLVAKRTKELTWKRLSQEIKNKIIQDLKSPRISDLLSGILSNNMIDWFNDCGNVGRLPWRTSDGKILLREDDGKNSAIRFWSKEVKIYYAPIVMVGNEIPGSYESITVAIGIGINDFTENEGGWPQPSSNSSWTKTIDIDSPLLSERIAEMTGLAEEKYFSIICEMIADEHWTSPKPTKLSKFLKQEQV